MVLARRKLYEGFTLIELSIVLVIISLIVGGVIGGRSLIRSAEVNSVISDINKYKQAINTYQLTYDALPGDHADAYDYFDGSGGNSVCGYNTVGSSDSCNGNGDGNIHITYEGYSGWKHLELAELIGGTYKGQYNAPLIVGEHFPASEIKGAGYIFSGNVGGYVRNRIIFAGYRLTDSPMLSVRDAFKLDKKLDDGDAMTGQVRAFARSGCIVWGPKRYKLDGTKCVLFFFIE